MTLTRTLAALSITLSLAALPACEDWNKDHRDGDGTMHHDHSAGNPHRPTGNVGDSGIGGSGTREGGATGGGLGTSGTSGGTGSQNTTR